MTAERISAIEAEGLAGAGLTPAIERLEALLAVADIDFDNTSLSRNFTRNLIDLLTRCRDTLERQSAELAAMREPALPRFLEIESDSVSELADETPLERLRFFCSLAMSGQDWLDVEPFFDALMPAASGSKS